MEDGPRASNAPAATHGAVGLGGEEPSLAVVVPAHEAEGDLPRCLDGLVGAGFAVSEIMVVDDGSTDGTAKVARDWGVRVLSNPESLGAAGARNRGAAEFSADILVFVDADVVVHAGTRARILAALAEPGVAAVFGSYDDRPAARGVVARYRNLLHHYVHQRGRREAATFWTGLGAVRWKAFVDLGGFDRAWECIEDSEFGVRLRRAGGRILLDPDLQGTHLKAWTLRSMVRTDLWGRAVPWARLVLFEGGPRDDLNMTAAHRVSAGAVAIFGLAVVAAVFEPRALWVAGAAVATFVWTNAAFFAFLSRTQGAGLALAALPVHALHYLAGGLGLVWAVVVEARRRRGLAAQISAGGGGLPASARPNSPGSSRLGRGP